jgi:ribosomal-protein-alanine N-acetyltransferase
MNCGEFVIERMTLEDLPQVLAIEQASFPLPFSENLFRMELNLDVAKLYVVRRKRKVNEGRSPSGVNGEISVAQMGGSGGEAVSPPVVTDDEVIGYIDYWHIGPEIHIITVAVHPDWRRRGIGSALMDLLLGEAKRSGAKTVSLDVRPSNQPALELYRKFGFEQTGLRRRYYQDNDEDALTMTLRIENNDETSA